MMNKLIGRILIATGFAVLAILFTFQAFGADINVIEVRRNIPLSDEAPVYKDFYINAGSSDGLKKNMVINIVRKMTIRDAKGTQAFGDLDILVGQLKVIALTDKIAVAREYKLEPRDQQPMLEQIGIMIGDRLDFEGAFIEKQVKK